MINSRAFVYNQRKNHPCGIVLKLLSNNPFDDSLLASIQRLGDGKQDIHNHPPWLKHLPSSNTFYRTQKNDGHTHTYAPKSLGYDSNGKYEMNLD